MSFLNIETANRFWAKVNKTDTCWLWTGAVDYDGYGLFLWNGVCKKAHRCAWALTHETLPGAACVLHKCDVRNCVRPDHLCLGSHTENMQERNRKKRNAWGERMGSSKLTESQVQEIRMSQDSQRQLAIRYKVGSTTIWCIKHNVTWVRLPQEESRK